MKLIQVTHIKRPNRIPREVTFERPQAQKTMAIELLSDSLYPIPICRLKRCQGIWLHPEYLVVSDLRSYLLAISHTYGSLSEFALSEQVDLLSQQGLSEAILHKPIYYHIGFLINLGQNIV